MKTRLLIYLDKSNISKIELTCRTLQTCQDNYEIVIADDLDDQKLTNQVLTVVESIAGDDVRYIQNDIYLGYPETINSIVQADSDWLIIMGGTVVNVNTVETLTEVINSSKYNMIAVPRSNNAGLATFPYSDYRFGTEHSLEESIDIFSRGKHDFADMTIVPFVDPFCVYFSKEVLSRCRELPANTHSAAEALVSYCAKVSTMGGRCVMSNQTYVVNNGISSDYFKDSVMKEKVMIYENSFQLTQDYFSSILYRNKNKRIKLLYFMLCVTDVYNGTAEHALSLLKELTDKHSDKFEISVLASSSAIQFHHLKEHFSNVYELDELTGIYDIGFCPFMLYNINWQTILDQHCLRIVGWNLDMIMRRCNYIFGKNPDMGGAFKLANILADGFVINSQSVGKDMEELFKISEFIKDRPVKPILLAVDETQYNTEEKLPFDKYFLVMGNAFKHKAIAETIPYLLQSSQNFIVFGAESTGAIGQNVYGYKSGLLSNEFLFYLYSHCEGLVFPSVYEGFGLPIIRALNLGKEVLINDNFLNREIIAYFADVAEHIHIYQRFSEIPLLVEQLKSGFEMAQIKRSWADVAAELVDYFDMILVNPTKTSQLNCRHDTFSVIKNLIQSGDNFEGRIAYFENIRATSGDTLGKQGDCQ